MDYASLLPFIDELRSLAAPLLGIPLTDQPRVALVAPPQQYTSSAEELVTVQVAGVRGKPEENGGFMGFCGIYPLVMTHIAIENDPL